jgi:hypothetical protein
MKKALLSSFLAAWAVAGIRADLLWYDTMAYPEGNITTNSSGLWIRHSGSGGDSLVVAYPGSGAALPGNHYEVNQSRSDDIRRWFDPVATNGYLSGTLYASFIVSVTNLPSNTGGSYFAHFADAGTTTNFGVQFRGRIFTVVPTNNYPYTTTVPGTFRFGLANAMGDSSFNTNGPTAVVPIDLALNTDYQVVLKYEVDNARCVLWVNPATEDDGAANGSGFAFDGGPVTNALACFCFRQALGEGVLELRDVVVGNSFSDVVTNTPAIPVIGLQPAGVTNYLGTPAILEVAASGMGVLTYQWHKDGDQISGATSQYYVIGSLQSNDQGNYFCVIGNTAGSTNSASAYVSVNTTPSPPVFVTSPQNTTNSVGGLATFSCAAQGTGPLNFQWALNGTPLVDGPSAIPGDLSMVSGAQAPVLKISNLSTNETGTYTVTVSGGAGSPASASAYLKVQPPNPVTIAYLRSLLNPSTWQTTDTTTMFTITGVITTFTNLTSGNTSSSYIQDETGGLNLFVSGSAAPTFRPQQGDIVTATGTLLSYNNNLELQCLTANPYQTYSVVGHTNLLPAPFVFANALTNDSSLMETNLEGRLAMVTNVTFTAQTTISTTANTTTYVTNSSGEALMVYFSAQDKETAGRTVSGFAWTISGVLSQYRSGSTYGKNGYELNVTRWADIVTTPPPAVTVTETRSGNTVTLSWDAVPYTYAYSVLAATDAAGPYSPLATGLTFITTEGRCVDTNAGEGQKFYKVSSP